VEGWLRLAEQMRLRASGSRLAAGVSGRRGDGNPTAPESANWDCNWKTEIRKTESRNEFQFSFLFCCLWLLSAFQISIFLFMRWLIVEDALRDRKGHWFEYLGTFARELRALAIP